MTQKIAFVTGSSRGIGKGIAIQLAKAGYDLGIHYSTTPDGAMDTKAQIEAMGRRACVYRADIRQLDQIQAMFQAFFQDFDHIDLMVNNAGVTRMKPFLEIGPDMFEEVINTDLRGSFFCAQAAARNMVDKQVQGVIINIASNHAIGCWPGSTVYAAAKAGLEKMGKNMAMELSKYGIRGARLYPAAGAKLDAERGGKEVHGADLQPHPHPSLRHPHGNRRRRGLPLLGKGRLHHRHHPVHRRRLPAAGAGAKRVRIEERWDR